MEQEKDITKLTELERFRRNPFIESLDIPKVHKVDYFNSVKEEAVAMPDGTAIKFNSFRKKNVVDPTKFVKLYSETIGIWFGFSKPAQNMIMYVMSKLIKNTDFIYASLNDYAEITKVYSRPAMNRGILELCNKGVLAKSCDTNKYFINPAYIFNGNRFATIELFEKEGASDNEPEDNITKLLNNIPDEKENQKMVGDQRSGD